MRIMGFGIERDDLPQLRLWGEISHYNGRDREIMEIVV